MNLADEKTNAARETFPAAVYAETVLSEVFEDAKRWLLEAMIETDMAHAVMLYEQNIITETEARVLFKALLELDTEAIRQVKYDGRFEDLFFYIEHLMAQTCGAQVAGRLHVARSRNDTAVTVYHLTARVATLTLTGSLLELRGVLLELASRHYETLIPAYTHTQPAQLTTLAHYFFSYR